MFGAKARRRSNGHCRARRPSTNSRRCRRSTSHHPERLLCILAPIGASATHRLSAGVTGMATIAPVLAFVFRPGGVTDENVYTDWPTLVAQLNGVQGRKILE